MSNAVEIEVLYKPGSPERINEDAYVCRQDEDILLLAAIDGATVRVESLALGSLFAAYGEGITAAAYAACLTRDTFQQHSHLPPDAMLLRANDTLREAICSIYGALTPQRLFSIEPHLRPYEYDPRFFRLVLPVCVATVVKGDLKSGTLTYAFAGDTALLLFYADGSIEQITWQRTGEFQPDRALNHQLSVDDNETKPQQLNIASGIYHNYVDAEGNVDLTRGIGCINGLPELDSYIQQGQRSLENITGVVVCSDGLLWPAPPSERDIARMQRLAHMRALIEAEGLAGYYANLRAKEHADSMCRQYARFKVHDDATGLYWRVRP